MLNKIRITVLMLLLVTAAMAQQPERPHLRIADTLTPLEKVNRNAVILQSELDSLIKLHNDKQAALQLPVQKDTGEVKDYSTVFLLGGIAAIIILLVMVLYLVYRHHQKINRIIAGPGKRTETVTAIPGNKEKNGKGKIAPQSLENKIYDLNAELHKLSKENEGLNRVIKEYNGIQHEYDSLKHGILKAYKVKNYPGYDKAKEDHLLMQGVLETENSVANYAYEKFLKPILSIADSNKNNPARISEQDRQKVLDLLVSLSFLYIEYLYLRVNDLSIGGKMVERIQGFAKGNGLDTALLKKLNTESGNRALVLRMVLNRAELNKLSYPVFDETNLNNQ
jgi:hypothetical protein